MNPSPKSDSSSNTSLHAKLKIDYNLINDEAKRQKSRYDFSDEDINETVQINTDNLSPIKQH